MQSKVWILNDPPEKEVQKDTFALKTRTLPELQDGQVLLKVIYLSNDPVSSLWIRLVTQELSLDACRPSVAG